MHPVNLLKASILWIVKKNFGQRSYVAGIIRTQIKALSGKEAKNGPEILIWIILCAENRFWQFTWTGQRFRPQLYDTGSLEGAAASTACPPDKSSQSHFFFSPISPKSAEEKTEVASMLEIHKIVGCYLPRYPRINKLLESIKISTQYLFSMREPLWP